MKKLLISTLVCLSLVTPTLANAKPKPPKPDPPVAGEDIRGPKGDITIEQDGDNIKITIENKKKTGTITIVKIDSDTKQPIAGVKFKLVDKATNTVIAEGVTNADGILIFDNLPIGDYYYEEIEAPKPY